MDISNENNWNKVVLTGEYYSLSCTNKIILTDNYK